MPHTLDATPPLRLAVTASYAAATPPLDDVLRQRVTAFVQEAHAKGWSRDRVLRGVERVVVEAGSVLSGSSAVIHPVFRLAEVIASEAIDRCYRRDTTGDVG